MTYCLIDSHFESYKPKEILNSPHLHKQKPFFFFFFTFIALWSCPALHADLCPTGVTAKVTKEVVTSPAQLVAERSKVIGVTSESQPVLHAETLSVVSVWLPLLTGIQHGGQEDSLDQLT